LVGQNAFDANAVSLEERRGSEEKCGRSVVMLVGLDLDIGQSAVVVDSNVEEVIAARLEVPAVLLALTSTQQPVAAARRHTAQLLYVDVDQLPRPVPDVANRNSTGSVEVAEPGISVPAQDCVDG
jgi:hypothetical protein